MTDESEHVAGRIQQHLAEDPRTHELGITASVHDEVVYLRGQVLGGERRQLVADVAAEAAAGRQVANEVSVVEIGEPGEEEEL